VKIPIHGLLRPPSSVRDALIGDPDHPTCIYGFDNRRWFDLTWVRYRRITLCADPPRASVIVASVKALVFSVTMRSASDWASGPPAKSFIILKCITCCVSNPSIAAWPVIFIQFLNNMFLRGARMRSGELPFSVSFIRRKRGQSRDGTSPFIEFLDGPRGG
jgi:hypothetical protein